MNLVFMIRLGGGGGTTLYKHSVSRILFVALYDDFNNVCFDLLLSILSHFSTRGSQVRCKLANYISKFKTWARTSQQSSQVHFNV